MRRLVSIAAALCALLVLAAGAWLWAEVHTFLERPLKVPPGGAQYVLEPGKTLTDVARDLRASGLLERPAYLVWLARWRGAASRIQAGEYLIQPGTRPGDLLDQFVAGRVRQYTLTIVEGWTFDQVLNAVAAHPHLKQTLDGLSHEQIMARLGHPEEHPEGRFFPDTYHFPRGTTDVEFLRRAYRAMEGQLSLAWANRREGLPYETPYEALIMASIVEKEAALPEERPAVAGVFVRRLQKGMRLQTDPTVIYGLGERYDGNLRRRDLSHDSPYNTYRHNGLPPTPIAMPGRSALQAAMHPEEGDALYFVSRGDGSHHFSATLDEHNEAVIHYQLKGRRKPFSSYSEGREVKQSQ